MAETYEDIHPVEIAAHTLLSGPLDSLNENFELLSQSQLILLTRLRIIEERLQSFKLLAIDGILDDKDVSRDIQKIKELRKRILTVNKTLTKVNGRLQKVEQKHK